MMKSLAVMFGCLVVVVLVGCGSEPPIATPTKFENWNAKDGTFRIDYPADWDANGGGRNSIQWARITKGNAEIHVEVKFSDSALADVMGAGGGMMGVGGPMGIDESDMPSPVIAIHEAKKDEVATDYSNYAEVGEAETFRPMLGEGRRTEFTASKGLVKIRGYRATILNNDRGIKVVCRCAESDWAALQDTFKQILDGMTRGAKEI
jgi:hypothetical protein